MQTDTSRSGKWRLLIRGSIVAMLLAGGSIGAVAPVAYGQEATAETAAINAAQILFEKKEYAAARELLRAYVADPKAALTFVRAGLALKLTDATDIALMAAQSQQGNATASRILGDLLRAGETPDLANAEVAYRLAVAQGDKASKLRMAQLFASANRIPEALEAYQAALGDFPDAEVKYLVLAITKGGYSEAELAPLLDRMDALAKSDPVAAQYAASIYEHGFGVPKDAAKAVAYARQAVVLGATTTLSPETAGECESCSALELVGLLKSSTKLGDAEKTAIALERPLDFGLYEDVFTIVQRFPAADRGKMAQHFIDRFKPVSNPVVGLTQALLKSTGTYRGELDGQLGSQTLAAISALTKAHNLEFDQFGGKLVVQLFLMDK